jgi:hypothetical protein
MFPGRCKGWALTDGVATVQWWSELAVLVSREGPLVPVWRPALPGGAKRAAKLTDLMKAGAIEPSKAAKDRGSPEGGCAAVMGRGLWGGS